MPCVWIWGFPERARQSTLKVNLGKLAVRLGIRPGVRPLGWVLELTDSWGW